MKPCKVCNHLISETARYCPYCGDTNKPSQNKYVAAILALLLGSFGIHHFYLNKPIFGILYILFSWTFIPTIISIVEALGFLIISEREFNKGISK